MRIYRKHIKNGYPKPCTYMCVNGFFVSVYLGGWVFGVGKWSSVPVARLHFRRKFACSYIIRKNLKRA